MFDFRRGKLVRKYDESMPVFEDANARGTLKLDTIDFGQRGAREAELEASDAYGTLLYVRHPPPTQSHTLPTTHHSTPSPPPHPRHQQRYIRRERSLPRVHHPDRNQDNQP